MLTFITEDAPHYIGWENMADIFKFIFCLELEIVLHKFQQFTEIDSQGSNLQ